MPRYSRRTLLTGGTALLGVSAFLGVRSLLQRSHTVIPSSSTPVSLARGSKASFASKPTPEPTLTAPATATPETTPSTQPAYTNGSGASGQLMPVGDLPGWRQIFAEDFNDAVPLGSFPGTVYKDRFWVYNDGTGDTAGQAGAPSRYYPSKVVSVENSCLNLYLHNENGMLVSAAICPYLSNHLYGKYTIRFRSDPLEDFKTAWLLWPDSEVWPRDGEIDFPEGPLDQQLYAVMHYQDGAYKDGKYTDYEFYPTSFTYTDWHTASTEWLADHVRFILDDQVIATSTTRIPDTPMHWVIQTESLTGYPKSGKAGNLLIDWAVAYAPA